MKEMFLQAFLRFTSGSLPRRKLSTTQWTKWSKTKPPTLVTSGVQPSKRRRWGQAWGLILQL